MKSEASLPGAGPTTTDVLASFLPRERLSRLGAPGLATRPRADRVQGAVLFVDVSGFTRLTEQLGRRGAIGSERLSQIIDACFGRMTHEVTGLGGDVIAYAGDAMLAMWPVTPERGLRAATCLAAQAALLAQAGVEIAGEAEAEPLRIRASVACGPLVLHEVGGGAGRWHFLVSGSPLADVAAADGVAEPGDIVLAPAAARVLGTDGVGSPLAGGFVRLREIRDPLVAPDTPRPVVPPERTDELRACVPGFLVSRLEAGHVEWLAEFRTVSVVFINLRDLAFEDADSDDGLHRAFAAMQGVVENCEGSVYQALVDDKGVTLVAAFGLPSQAFETDAARAVRCALEAHRDLLDLGFASSIGATTGLAFTGIYGTDSRRQYTLVGSVMNRCARLAQAAANGILCDEATQTAASGRGGGSFATHPPLQLKGIEGLVPVWRPIVRAPVPPAAAPAGSRAGSVIGRTEERALLDAALDGFVAGDGGGLVVIEGEAGIGKSRLAFRTMERARESGARCLVGQGQQIERHSVLHAWRPVFEALFGVSGGAADADALRETLRRFSGEAPGTDDLLPLLGSVLPVDIPDNERTGAMPAEARAEATRALLIDVLRGASESGPVVLLVEDAHWLDSASLALLAAVVDRLPALLVIVSSRPPEPEAPPQRHWLNEAAGPRRIDLRAMQESESAALIRHCLGVDRVSDEVTAVIHRRAQGNPFFSEQLALALRDYGIIGIHDGTCSVADATTDLDRGIDEHLSRRGLPGTLQGIVSSRVDRLGPGPQLTVKLASVIGPRFDVDALVGVHPDEVQTEELAGWLEELVRLKIAIPEPAAPDAAFAFRHAILRDVVYNSLTFGQRRATHTAVAEWFERDDGGGEARNFPVLAHHWARAGVDTKATGYLGKAGDHALERYANQEAVRFFEEALAIDRAAGGKLATPDDTRAAWELQLGAAYVNWSRYEDALPHLGNGLALKGHRAPGSPVADGLGLAGQMARQVAHRLWSDRFVGRDRGTAPELRRVARAYESLVEAFYLENATLPCLLSAVRSLNLAELSGSSAELARGYASFGAILGFVPAQRLADGYFRRAIRTADETGDASARAWVGLAAGVYKIGVGSWEEAAGHLGRTREASERLGDRRRWEDAVQNLAALDFLLGRYASSLAAARELHASAADRKDERGLSVALRRQALCLLATNQLAELGPCLEELSALAGGTGDLYRDLPPLALRAQLHLREGRYREAFEAADAGLEIMTASTPTFHDSLSDFVNVSRVLLALRRIMEREVIAGVPDLGSRSRDACRALKRFARVFPIGRPYALLHGGVRLQAENRLRGAEAQWRKGILAATELGMEPPEALVRLELGRHLLAVPTHAEEGREHLSRATETFDRLGAASESAEARMSLPHV